jgi:heterogeneous nuclear rnp K-like protein 2
MAETTKRARSPSPLQGLGSETKRAKEEEEEHQQTIAAQDSTKTSGMATDGSATVAKNDEGDAVELGLPHEGEEVDLENKEEKDDGEGLLQGGVMDANDSGHADADGQPANIAIRALIVTGDASVIIGKQGKHINEIRDKSGAKLTIVSAVPAQAERRRKAQYADKQTCSGRVRVYLATQKES